MSNQNYWARVSTSRVSRRRGLALAGGSAVAGAFLAACGGGDKAEESDKSGLLTKFTDTTKQAKRGGILKDRTFSDTPSLSTASGSGNFANPVSGKVYSTLLRAKLGYMEPQDVSDLEG